ncbi:ion transporter [Fructobacillus sp. M1-13]|uniref:Ion transporter n=1 Tax=Fructobacillus papyriferae TaxID=2713171 RepID=A0ABS5QNH5_9LACO|nr:ion transporter [Fructobacillus papyriferae]MBS9334626.1 ion transporter [Fructobacillus papyriferae]MCD2158616.1 ion transporter [Fructobacillus papyriferae]
MKKLYYATVFTFAIVSVVLAGLDIGGFISITSPPYLIIDKFILIFFWIDYIVRITLAKDKWHFFKSNIFDLLAIIPFDSMFAMFRIARTVRLLKLLKFIRIIGFAGRFKHNVTRFINTNGFIYLMSVAIALVLISAGIYSLAENVNYGNALWWAIVTSTTVGYGDISPATAVGKGVAIVLMFVGIGLIGTITSTVTTFFTQQQNEESGNELKKQLDEINQKLDRLESKLGDKNETQD